LERKELLKAEISQSGTKYEVFIEIAERLRFAISRACFDAEIGFQHVRRVEWSEKSI
jgi:hypothetical protein